LQQDDPDDYVIATNETHSVKEFIEKTFAHFGLYWQDFVEVSERFLRPLDVNYLKGDSSKAKEKLGWFPKVKFDELVTIMVDTDLERRERWKKGENFPWDANNYPKDIKILYRKL